MKLVFFYDLIKKDDKKFFCSMLVYSQKLLV